MYVNHHCLGISEKEVYLHREKSGKLILILILGLFLIAGMFQHMRIWG